MTHSKRVWTVVDYCISLHEGLAAKFPDALRRIWPMVVVVGLVMILMTGCATGTKGTLAGGLGKEVPRICGHVGCILVGRQSSLLEVLHASSSKGTTVIQPFEGVLVRDLAKVRRLTISEATGKK